MSAYTNICHLRALSLTVALGFAATGGFAFAAAAGSIGQDGVAPVVTESSSANLGATEAFGSKQYIEIGSIDFHPIDDAPYAYSSPGGVAIASGNEFFNAGIPLPVGAKLLRVVVFVDPNGSGISATVNRYDPLNVSVETLGNGSSSSGTGSESFKIKTDVIVEKGWNYRLGNLNISSAGQIIYGARVVYKLPK